jgi:hypothetical protein
MTDDTELLQTTVASLEMTENQPETRDECRKHELSAALSRARQIIANAPSEDLEPGIRKAAEKEYAAGNTLTGQVLDFLACSSSVESNSEIAYRRAFQQGAHATTQLLRSGASRADVEHWIETHLYNWRAEGDVELITTGRVKRVLPPRPQA